MAVNIRVELRQDNPHATSAERKQAFDAMFHAFNKKVKDARIKDLFKERQYFESKADKRRRKQKKAELERRKDKLREYFG